MNLQQFKKISLSFLLLLLTAAGAFAQVRDITGQITDPDGKPLVGATVSVKGVSGNVITDANGKYKLQAMPEQTIVITYVGYGTKEIRVGNNSTISTSLAKGDNQLDEFIVIG